MAFQPPCRKWACPDCRVIRSGHAARHYLSKAGAHKSVWAATLPGTREVTRHVQNAWSRRGEGGRLTIKLTDGRSIYVSSTDFLLAGARPVAPNVVQLLLRDPATPISGVRFLRDWAVPKKTPGTQLYLLAMGKDEASMFLGWSGMSLADLEGEGTATLEEVHKAADQWKRLW